MSEVTLPAVFAGATHRLNGIQPVKALRWEKDGDHPLVSRYPIERRDYKGLLTVDPKNKFGLRFGEWIIEDADGAIWVEGSQDLPAKYLPIETEGVA
jgi:hypothetical protein